MTIRQTRAERAASPLARDSIRTIAESVGGCLRPVQLRRTDKETGAVEQVMKPCGATLASICPPCAQRAKQLREVQCREGWHLEAEPDLSPAAPDEMQEYWLLLRCEAQVKRDRAEARGEDTGELDALIEELDIEIAPFRCPRHRHHQPAQQPQRRHRREAEDPPGALHPSPPGRPGSAEAEDRPDHGRQVVHHQGRQVVPAIDVPDLDV